jgi:hypothetical protein
MGHRPEMTAANTCCVSCTSHGLSFFFNGDHVAGSSLSAYQINKALFKVDTQCSWWCTIRSMLVQLNWIERSPIQPVLCVRQETEQGVKMSHLHHPSARVAGSWWVSGASPKSDYCEAPSYCKLARSLSALSAAQVWTQGPQPLPESCKGDS